MPKFTVTSPDGKSWVVNAPEGATADQALAFAKQQWQATQQPKQEVQPPPFEDPGFGRSMLIGAGRTFDRVGKGFQQAYYTATGDDKALANLKAEAESDDRFYKPLRDARPWATGIGEALPSIAIPGGGGKTLLSSAGRMFAAGAVPGLLEYGSAGDRLNRAALGGAAGALLPVAGAGLKTGAAFLEPLFDSGRQEIVGRALNQVAGMDAPDVRMRLKSAAPVVRGSMPTAAQVAESGGIAAMERAAAQANPQAYTNRAMEQSSARLNALRGIAGDDAGLAAAKAARQGAADAMYGVADYGVAPLDNTFAGLARRPQFQSAIARAQELAQNEGLDDIFFRGANGQPVALMGKGAHFIKKALDEAGELGSSSYSGKAGAKAARGTNDLFQEWLDKSIPEYAQAKQAFAQHSAPVNQMEIGRALVDKAAPALADFGALGRETAATFAGAVRNGDALAAKVTGFPGAKMADVLTPEQMATVTGVAKDLARKANAQDLGRGVGSDTFQKLSMNNIAQQSGMPRLMGGLLEFPGISRATRWVYQDADQKAQGLLADALLNPQEAAGLMDKASKKALLPNSPKTRKVIDQTLLRAGLLGVPLANPTVEP